VRDECAISQVAVVAEDDVVAGGEGAGVHSRGEFWVDVDAHRVQARLVVRLEFGLQRGVQWSAAAQGAREIAV
jgi:hypothetical protein